MEAEFARPLWVFGMNSYEVIESCDRKNLIACTYRYVYDFVDVICSGLCILFHVYVLSCSTSNVMTLNYFWPETDVGNNELCVISLRLRHNVYGVAGFHLYKESWNNYVVLLCCVAGWKEDHLLGSLMMLKARFPFWTFLLQI